jgi:hypothetical protein
LDDPDTLETLWLGALSHAFDEGYADFPYFTGAEYCSELACLFVGHVTAQSRESTANDYFAARSVATSVEQAAHTDLLRDIFGNPFHSLSPRPDAIATLAEQIYAGKWELMPILGEWLQEDGYWSEGEHCLDPNNQHVKGCWVVDWVTGQE